jgi:hypothetical protein
MAPRGTPFSKGQTGNPAGRPKGSRNRATVALEAILDGDAEAILRKAVALAQEGDPVALRMCMDRLLPVRKDRPVLFDLPPIDGPADLPRATGALLAAVAAGELTPSEAADIGKAVDAHVKALEVSDLAVRLAKLEEARP